MTKLRLVSAVAVLASVGVGLVAACSGSSGGSGFGAVDSGMTGVDAGDGGAGPVFDGSVPMIESGASDSGGTAPVMPTGPVTDFPTPVIAGTAPTNAPSLFGPTTQGATSSGPCLVEPGTDAVFPQNWLRPLFTWQPAAGENLFELRLHVANQIDDLVVYTDASSWTMPKTMWDALRTHSPTEAMTLTVRGGVLSNGMLQSESLGTSTPMGIAPVQATGAIVYWTTNDTMTGSAALKGFSPGDESVEVVLTPTQYSQEQQTTSFCIGCHSSTPDGDFVAFTTTTSAQQTWSDALALIDPDGGTVGSAPSYLTPTAAAALARTSEGALTFSPAHWQTGDRRGIVSYDPGGTGTNVGLTWVDFEATSATQASATMARNGDSQLAGAPAWSHDGTKIVYVSTNRVCTGRLGNCTPQYTQPQDVGSRAALDTVPYAAGAGGAATPVPGASDSTSQSYYPSFSPDDQWILFNQIPNDDNMYDQPAAELFVVPAAGGTATRLAANDPAQCSGVVSPGITNSWGKWAPTALPANGGTYYWVVFSSKRMSSTPQLYIASLVVGADGTLTTHGAIYLWNQPATEANHTPAWDTFKVPPVINPP
jgi:WD40-like Beta Propeller Repeat